MVGVICEQKDRECFFSKSKKMRMMCGLTEESKSVVLLHYRVTGNCVCELLNSLLEQLSSASYTNIHKLTVHSKMVTAKSMKIKMQDTLRLKFYQK